MLRPIALALILAPCSLASGLDARVYIDDAALQRVAESSLDVAGRLLRDTAGPLRWRLCGAGGRDTADCRGALGDWEINIQIVDSPAHAPGALGMAFIGQDGSLGRRVHVYRSAVASVAQSAGVALDRVLGHVIAHEIGHLLLGSHSHSKRGLMRADWSRWDVASMRGAGLRFNKRDARAVTRRVQSPQTRIAHTQDALSPDTGLLAEQFVSGGR